MSRVGERRALRAATRRQPRRRLTQRTPARRRCSRSPIASPPRAGPAAARRGSSASRRGAAAPPRDGATRLRLRRRCGLQQPTGAAAGRRGKDGAVYPLSARAHSTRVQSRLRTADPCLHRAHSARREAWAAFAPLTAVAGLRLFAVRSPEDWRAGDARAGWPPLALRAAADERLSRCRSGRSEVRCLAPSRCCTEGWVDVL